MKSRCVVVAVPEKKGRSGVEVGEPVKAIPIPEKRSMCISVMVWPVLLVIAATMVFVVSPPSFVLKPIWQNGVTSATAKLLEGLTVPGTLPQVEVNDVIVDANTVKGVRLRKTPAARRLALSPGFSLTTLLNAVFISISPFLDS